MQLLRLNRNWDIDKSTIKKKVCKAVIKLLKLNEMQTAILKLIDWKHAYDSNIAAVKSNITAGSNNYKNEKSKIDWVLFKVRKKQSYLDVLNTQLFGSIDTNHSFY